MAEKRTRTFWIIPGEVDKKGDPVEHATKPSVGIAGTGISPLGIGLGANTKEPVQVTEEMSPDGEYVQYTTDPTTGQRQEIGRGIDKGQLDLAKERRATSEAEQDRARQTAKDTASAETPEERALRLRKEAAQTTTAEAAASKATAPETIRTGRMTTIGPEGQQAPETVTKTQFDADRAMASDRRQEGQDARQAQIDLQTRVQQAEESARAAARLRIEQDRWTADQAASEYNKKLDQIRLEMQRETMALTRRSQDISLRGQDIDAGVSQRNTDVNAAEGAMRSGVAWSSALLPYMNAPGQVESTNSLMGGGPPVPTRPLPVSAVAGMPQQIAQQTMGMMPPQYQLPGAPPQPPVQGQYTLPG